MSSSPQQPSPTISTPAAVSEPVSTTTLFSRAENGMSPFDEEEGPTTRVPSSSTTQKEAAQPCFIYSVIIVLCLLYFVQGGVENAVSSSVLTTMQQHFNSSNVAVATAQRMAEVTKTAGCFIFGHLAVHYKLAYVCAGSVIFAIGTVVVGLSPRLWFAGIGYFIYGIGYSTTIVLTPPILNDLFVFDKARGTCFLGVILAMLAIGIMMFFVIGAFAYDQWRALYIGCGVAGLIPGIFLVLSQRSALLTKSVIVQADFSSDSQRRLPFFHTMWSVFWQRKVIFFLTIAQIFLAFYTAAFTSFIPKFVEVRYQKSKQTANLVIGATVPAVVVATLLGGGLVRWYNIRLLGQLRFCVVSAVLSIPWITCMWMAENLTTFVPLLIIAMVFTFLPTSPGFGCLALSVTCEMHVSYANSVMQFISRLFGAVTGPILFGLMLDHEDSFLSFRDVYMMVGVVCSSFTAIFGGLAWWCYTPAEYPDHHHHEEKEKTPAQRENDVVEESRERKNEEGGRNDDEHLRRENTASSADGAGGSCSTVTAKESPWGSSTQQKKKSH